jgi:hypothetical protein
MLIHFHRTPPLRHLIRTFLLLAAFCATGTAHAVNYSGTYSETFNSMGVTGTVPPTGWSVKVGNIGSTNTTWAAIITGTGTNSVASMVATAGSLTSTAAPSSTNNSGLNAQGFSSTDRVLATSPTSISGSALELTITNTTGATITALQVGYDIRRYTAPASANELPGYWFFYSHDNGATWTNVSTLNPVISGTNGVVVPNSVGVTTVPGTTFILSASWEANQTLLLRWVDDNAVQTSPDQIIGLDNVTILTPNQPPVVTLYAPLNNETVIGQSANLKVSIADPEGDAVKVTFYGRTKASAPPGPDFSLIVLPDSQYYSQNSGGNLAAIFQAQTQWIVNNRAERSIAFVSHMGDLTQNGDNGGNPSEWINADQAMALIEDPSTTQLPDGIPWGVMSGNHDLLPGSQNATGVFYNQYFGVSRFAGRSWYGGHYGTTNNNNYQLFSASGLDFIVINLAYRSSPDQTILDWADTLLKAHPNRRAIITSHWIVNTGDPASFGGAGQAIYDRLKSNPNLILMLCGHIHGEGKRSDIYEGRTVHTILSDYQSATNGGNGFLRILAFSPSSNTIHVESYSPTLDRSVNSSDGVVSWTGPYNLPCPLQEVVGNWGLLGMVDVPAGGTMATLSWSGLTFGTSYEWYTSATDGITATTSSIGIFTTTPDTTAPTISFSTPISSTGSTVSPLFSAIDDVQVTGYMLNGTATPPLAGDPGWVAQAPASYTFTGIMPGILASRTLYAWAKDAAGNIASNSANVDITIPLLNINFFSTTNGGGQINSDIGGVNCNGNPCSVPFDFSIPPTVNLVVAADTNSFFTGWDVDCSGSGICTLTLNASRKVSANFDRLQLVKIPGITTTYYGLLGNAYKEAADGDTIQATASTFSENFLLNRPIKIKLKGGFDLGYGGNSGYSTIKGTLIINNGELMLERLYVK